jgi:hypothetical protein
MYALVLREIHNAPNIALLGVFTDLNPAHSDKLRKSYGNSPEVLPKRLDVAAYECRSRAEVALIVGHGKQ